MTTRNSSRVGAIILAAGRSERMGEAKQLLRLGESTMLGQTLENLRGAGVDEIVLVLGFASEAILRELSAAMVKNLKVVVNQTYGLGMAGSLQQGISALDPRTGAALVVLADQPFIRSGTFGQIVNQYRRSSTQIVIPTYQGVRGNPVLLDRSVFPEVMALTGDVGCRTIFGSHSTGVVKVELDDVGILLDIDNREDYERLRHFDQFGEEQKALIEAATREGRSEKQRE
jgi:molybdenum cofactor cytidylyltransferase